MSQISKQALKVDNNTSFPNNTTGYISPTILRGFNTNMIDSLVDEITFTAFSSSVTSSIQLLNAYTASIQPSFTSLNQFTSSQELTNLGFTTQISSLSATQLSQAGDIAQLQTTASLTNEIISSNVSLGYARRFNFSGFITASLVTNVDGTIADITMNQDGSKLNTSSFNDYTASTAATQSVFSASVATSLSASVYTFNKYTSSTNTWTASAQTSIDQLLNFSSSLDATFATDAQLNAATASLINQIDTKLNTSSFNSYTQSQEVYSSSVGNILNDLISHTGSYATTGSNNFVGNQVITGSLLISGSSQFDLDITGAMKVSSNDGLGQSTISGNNIGVNNSKGTSATFIQNYGPTGSNAGLYMGVYDDPNFNTDIETAIVVDSNGIAFKDWDNGTVFDYVDWLTITPNVGNNPSPRFVRGLQITGSVSVTGSVYGNISALTISSNSASMDLSKGNFFTLSLVSGSATHLTATNIKPGQTINLLITQSTPASGSLTYNSTFKFPAGNSYVATPISGAKDIITFIAYDTTTLYATSINNLL